MSGSGSPEAWPAGTSPFKGCKVCRTPAPYFGVVDFNKSCEEARGLKLPLSGQAVYYRRCPSCGFVFTDAFDTWSRSEFQERIYNAAYAQVDPDYSKVRPGKNAQLIARLFGTHREAISVLDYGGGNGYLAECLRRVGFSTCDTYDLFTPGLDMPPVRKYNLVTCFETLEHVPDPAACVRAIAASLDDEGLAMFSTLVQPNDFEKHGLSWWYVGPRNGHISIYSVRSLRMLWGAEGCVFASSNQDLHFAFRKLPGFASEAIKINQSPPQSP